MKNKKVMLASSCDHFYYVYVNGLAVARVKELSEIDENKMNDEQKMEWAKVTKADLEKLKLQFADFKKRGI